MSKKFVERAAGAFMTQKYEFPRWDGIAKLSDGAKKAAVNAGADPDIFRGYVNLMGRHHDALKQVKAKYSLARTYLYANTLPFERGVYLIPVARVPEVMAKVAELKKAADAARDAFLVEYDRMIKIAQHDSMGDWRREVKSKYPSAESIRGRFGIIAGPPKAIPVIDMSRIGSIPVAMADDIVSANENLLEEQLKKAKDAAMTSAREQMEVLVRQLDIDTVRFNKEGKEINPRFKQTLITNSQRVARMLRDMTQGYDHDPQVLALANLIDDKIGSIKTTDTWKTVPATRKASLHAANKVVKGLSDLQKAAAKKAAAPKRKPAANKSSKSQPAFGGVLADLLT